MIVFWKRSLLSLRNSVTRLATSLVRSSMTSVLSSSLGKHSAHARVVMGSAGCDCRLRGECLRGRSPGPAEHEVVQDVYGVAAVLAGGVDVAADVEPVLGDVVAGQAAGDFLLGFQGPDSS